MEATKDPGQPWGDEPGDQGRSGSYRKEVCSPKTDADRGWPEAVYVESAVEVQEVVFVMDRFGYCKLG